MTRYQILRNFCKRGVLALAIMLSIKFIFDFYPIVNLFTTMAELSRYSYSYDVSSFVTSFLSALPSVICNGLVLLGTWMLVGCVPGGGSIIKVITVIYRVFLFIGLGLISILATLLLIVVFAEGVFELFIPISLVFGVVLFFILFYQFMYRQIGLIATDLQFRLSTENTMRRIEYPMQVGLKKFLITLIVFGSIGLTFRLASLIIFTPDVLEDIIYDLTYDFYEYRYEIRNFLTSLTYSWNSVFTIFTSVYNIALCGFGVGLVSMYQNMISESSNARS